MRRLPHANCWLTYARGRRGGGGWEQHPNATLRVRACERRGEESQRWEGTMLTAGSVEPRCQAGGGSSNPTGSLTCHPEDLPK